MNIILILYLPRGMTTVKSGNGRIAVKVINRLGDEV